MMHILDYPVILGVVSFAVLWLSTLVGVMLRSRWHGMEGNIREDYGVTLGATLTLLGLIIGFTFSMSTTRYDQRKVLEEEEANAIGTEYVRVDLLDGEDAAKLRPMLVRYTDLRVHFYKTRDLGDSNKINAETASLQNQLWAVVAKAAKAQPGTNSMLVTSGMNDVLNSQGYTQAAWWNRIPLGAWAMMYAISIVCHVLLGYGSHGKYGFLSVVLPLLVAVSFLLIADIDSPRGGVIRVQPQNLIALADSLGKP